jgi:hypothetical protein
MKKYILAGAVVASAMTFAYVLTVDRNKTAYSKPSPAVVASNSEVEQKIDELAQTVSKQMQSYRDMIEQTRLEQSRLNNVIAGLEEKMQSPMANPLEQNEQPDESTVGELESVRESDAEELAGSESARINEREMGRWMDDVLSSGYLDDVATTLAAEQVESSVVNLSGVHLAEMLCSQRFCRASFAREDGKAPDIESLLGTPPFVNEGFTVKEPDGTLRVYFTDSGVSLGELQDEALQGPAIYN